MMHRLMRSGISARPKEENLNTRRLVSTGLLVVLIATMLAGPVAAEGARYSSMYDVLTGFNFRDFYDSNSDATSTWAELGDCWLSNPNLNPYTIQLNLWEVHSWAPDYDMGARWFWDYDPQYWWRMSANTYHFTVTDYNNASLYNKLSCNTVNYGW